MSSRRPPSVRPRGATHRALVLYLTLIVVPTLALAYLGLRSVKDQQDAVSVLTESNRRLTTERVAAEIERLAFGWAESVLSDAELHQAAARALAGEPMATVTRELAAVHARHDIVDEIFVLAGGGLRYPRLTSRAHALEAILTGDRHAGTLVADIRRAERLELTANRPDLALPIYQRAGSRAETPAARALALARTARCLLKLGRRDAAVSTFYELSERYGDERDPFERPYALVAGTEVSRLVGETEAARAIDLATLHRDLLAGRWYLTSDQAEYYDDRLRLVLGDAAGARAGSRLFDRLALAQLLSERFAHQGSLEAGAVQASALADGPRLAQTFYTAIGNTQEPAALVGFVVDLEAVRERLVEAARREAGVETPFAIRDAERSPAGAAAPTVRLRTVFPFWSVADTSGTAPSAVGARAFAAMMAVIIGLLVLGVVLLVRDVSRERDLNRLRADLVNGVSHDLKTPLTVIRLYADTVRKLQGPSDEERARYAGIIAAESQRLGHLIENILNASQIERGLKQYRVEYGEIAPVVLRLLDTYGPYLRERGFEIRAEIDDGLPTVRLDAAAAAEAVLNVLDNALKYSGEAKQIALRVRRLPDAVAVEVEDRGVGIPAEEQARVFRQFYRRREHLGAGGYGLGLFLVQHTLAAHGGRVEVDSAPGRGSVFRLIFPALDTKDSDAWSSADSPRHHVSSGAGPPNAPATVPPRP